METRQKHFYSLDNLRGVAALLVVIYHWSNFFINWRSSVHGDPHQLPLYAALWPIYEQGLHAVDLFFCLSGFIFFWLYAQKISENNTTFKKFFILRFSRLYPLHFATLLAVASMTYVIRHMDASRWGDQGCNDWYHFVLQLFFVSNWGWENGFSFNLPIWSVSVEIWLYLMFFCLCRLNFTNWKHLAGYVVFGWFLMHHNSWFIGKGVICFFTGGLAFKTFQAIQASNIRLRTKPILLALAAMWFFLPINFQMNLAYRALCHITTTPNNYGIGGTIVFFTTYSYDLLLFPITIVLLALWETQRGTLGRRFSFLGEISYSSYLLHFPLQLLLVTMAIHWGWPKTLFASPITLLIFLTALIIFSIACHRVFEKPMQSWLRKKLLAPAKPG